MGRRKNKQPSHNSKNIVASSLKDKIKNQKKKAQNNTPNDFNTFQTELSQLKDQALKEHNEASQIAKKSYNSLIDSIDQSDIILQILDARDPHGSRLLEVEKLVKEKGKKLINVINKVDLIPKEVALRWLGDPSFQIDELSQLLTFVETQDQNILSKYKNDVKVVAVTLKSDAEQQQAWNVLNGIITAISSDLQNLPSIAIIGINQSGKSTIYSLLNANNNGIFNKILDVPSYSFISSTDTAAILNAIDYCGDIADLWLDFVDRSQDESIFDVLGIEPTEDVDVIQQYAKATHKKVSEATKEIVDKLLSGEQLFFSVPEDTPAENLSEFQQAILNLLPPADSDSDSIHINRGEPLEIDDGLLK